MRKRIPRDGRARAAAGLVLGVLGVAGCSLMTASDEDVYAFSHRTHVTVEGMDCSVCHKLEPGAALPTMPEPGLCLLCHKDMDAEKPQSRRIHNLFRNDVFLAAHASRLDEELVFDHGAHVDRGVDCASCHVGIRESVRITDDDAISMEACMTCHGDRGVDQSCNVCHTVIDEEWRPESHFHQWDVEHGLVVRADVGLQAQRCDLCHNESTCVECHQSVPPRNHDNLWRLHGHGIVASLDRQNCATCHRDDYCIRCHEETRPRSHTALFGSPRNQHCAGCHFPLRSEGCVTCHGATPSHQMATPLPPDHDPAMNCRLCHGAGAPLVHFDDGTNCLACHR